jgi:putative membrane protein
MMPLQFLRGFLMGSADVVPGVSGGTVALVVGIYPRLVANIRHGSRALGSFARLQFSAGGQHVRQIEWNFLLPLLAGIAVALVSLARLVETLLEDHPVEMAALFFGLVAASVVVARGMVSRWDWARITIFISVALIAFAVLGYRSGEAESPATWIFFFAGAFAISAMIIPGVSGSFLLLMLGMYEAVLAAVNDREIDVLTVFVVGAVIGLAVFSSALHWALETHHDVMMAAITGLLLGSLRVLWPWPNGIDGPELSGPIADEFAAPFLLAVVGVGIVFLLTRLGQRSGAAVDA